MSILMTHVKSLSSPRFASLILLLMITALNAGPELARATPRYAAAYGQTCILCHENPTGGGLRNLYATQYIIPEELAARGWQQDDGSGLFNGQSPEISENISIGTDLRTLSFRRRDGDDGTFAMQGDLYLNFRLSSTAAAYVEQGLNGSGEIYGILHSLPGEGYLKAGRFVPDYGWRFADHQMFNRRYLFSSEGSDSPAFLFDSGFEIGGSPGIFEYSASLLSGPETHGDNYAARAMVRQEWFGVRVGVGASVWRRYAADGHQRAVAGIWYLSAGPVTWLGEVDETKRPDGEDNSFRLGNMLAQELAVTVARGWDVRLTYGFQDPNRAAKTGSRQRYGGGVAYMPRPFLALQVMANYWDFTQGPDVPEASYPEGVLMVHFFY